MKCQDNPQAGAPVVDHRKNVEQLTHCHSHPCFFSHLALQCRSRQFVGIHVAAWQRPQATAWFDCPPNQQDVALCFDQADHCNFGVWKMEKPTGWAAAARFPCQETIFERVCAARAKLIEMLAHTFVLWGLGRGCFWNRLPKAEAGGISSSPPILLRTLCHLLRADGAADGAEGAQQNAGL